MNVHNRSLHASLTTQPFIEIKDKTQLYNLNMKLYKQHETKTKQTKNAKLKEKLNNSYNNANLSGF